MTVRTAVKKVIHCCSLKTIPRAHITKIVSTIKKGLNCMNNMSKANQFLFFMLDLTLIFVPQLIFTSTTSNEHCLI